MMTNLKQDNHGDDVQPCQRCGQPIPPRKRPGGNAKRYCSELCRVAAQVARERDRRANLKRDNRRDGIRARARRPLPEFARDAAWTLRRDVERLERIFADDRFSGQKEEVTTLLRGHLSYAAEVCQDLLSRINHSTGE